jgi:light-regulated signal transduction histidine kinase (bacteriophytochrome)
MLRSQISRMDHSDDLARLISTLARLDRAQESDLVADVRALICERIAADSVAVEENEPAAAPANAAIGRSESVSIVAARSAKPFTRAELATLQAVADVVSLLLEKHRLRTALAREQRSAEEIVYVTAHDLREPLRTMAAYSMLLHQKADLSPEDRAQCTEFMVQAAKRADRLLDDLLAYSRAGSANDTTETSMGSVFEWALMNLSHTITQAGAAVSQTPLPALVVSPSEMTFVFQELIGNAIKFRSEQMPVVQVSAERSGNSWTFRVQDNGIGIDPQYADLVFRMFKRLHGREVPGNGAGLAICARIIERRGGRIWVDSQLGRGSSVYFTIPEAPL